MNHRAGLKAIMLLLPFFLVLATSGWAIESLNQQVPQEDSNNRDTNYLAGENSNEPAGLEKETLPQIKDGFPAAWSIGESFCNEPPAEIGSNAIGAEGYTSNVMLCSNPLSGQYCENLESSCSQTTWAYPSTYFYTYMRAYDIFHNNQYNYSIRIDAQDPNGNDISWWNGSQTVDYLEYTYSGSGNWAYLCNWFGTYLTTPTGQWTMQFRLHDNITNENYYFSKQINIKCDNDSHCPSNQKCQNQQCIMCNNHATYKCANDDLYWFDSCDRQQEIKEDCRVSCEWNTTEGYHCFNGCKANWKIYAFDLWKNGQQNAVIYYNLWGNQGWQFAGQTNSVGLLEFTRILNSACGHSLGIKTISAEGADCGEKSGYINKENDTDTFFFLCKKEPTTSALKITANQTKENYEQGENITININVEDNSGNNIQGTFIGITRPDGSTATAPQTDASGNSAYTTTAEKEGTQKYTIIATKVGYKYASKDITIAIKEKPKTAIEVTGTNKQPIAGATIFINGIATATTNAQGKTAIATPPGTNTIEVKSEGESCGAKTSQGAGSKNIVCEQKGDLVVRLLSPDGSPIANAYIQIEGKQTATTNASGAHYYKGINYGKHEISIFISIKKAPELEYQNLTTSTQVTVNSAYYLKEFILTTAGIQTTASAENKELLTLENFEISTATIGWQEFTEKGAVIKGKINLDQKISNQELTTTPATKDICIDKYLLNGEWAEKCGENQIRVATDALTNSVYTRPIAMNCGDAKCHRNDNIELMSYIAAPVIDNFIGTDGLPYQKITYNTSGKGGHIKPCLDKLGMNENQIISHINNAVLVPGTRTVKYNQHIGRFKENGQDCTVFYEAAEFLRTNGAKGCEKSCEKPPKEYIKNPPVPYPSIIPSNELGEWIDKVIKHNDIEQGWPSLQGFNPFLNIGVIAPAVAGGAIGAFILWEAAKPLRCIIAILLAPYTLGGSIAICAT